MTPECLPMELYDIQLFKKVIYIKNILEPFSVPVPQIFRSPTSHYRMRAEFRLWQDGNDIYHVIFDQKTKIKIRVNSFPAASKLINQMMPLIIEYVRNNPILRCKLFQVNYLTTKSNQAIISLLYHRTLDRKWRYEAKCMRDIFRLEYPNIHLIGRSKKNKIMLDCNYINEHLQIANTEIVYRQIENCFTQPNTAINVKMLEWALNVTKGSKGDLFELYCGNGNFSLALARNFDRVLATEINRDLVEAARYNVVINNVNNVKIVRMSAKEFFQAISGVRYFNRLRDINIESYRCKTILVNPPRCGLDKETEKLIRIYPKILYISCNLRMLRKNLEGLIQTYKIEHLAFFDQFPYTCHIECAVLLIKK